MIRIDQQDDVTLAEFCPPVADHYAILLQRDSRIVAAEFKDQLSLYVVQKDQKAIQPHLIVDNVKVFDLKQGRLVVATPEGKLTLYEESADWKPTSTFVMPEEYMWEHGISNLNISPSGQYLLIKVHFLHALLVRLPDWDNLTFIQLSFATGHHDFVKTMFGRELLFISTQSYLGFDVYDCARAKPMASLSPTNMWNFCHTDYLLSPDGKTLATFGCIWADAYRTVIYDVSAWRWLQEEADFQKLLQHAPAPLEMKRIHWQQYSLQHWETYLELRALPEKGGEYWFVSTVELEDLPMPGSEDYNDLFDEIDPMDAVIFDELRRLAKTHPAALVSRSVRISDGTVTHFRCFGTPKVSQQNIHLLAGNRVMMVGQSISILDTANGHVMLLKDLRDTPDARHYHSVCSPDGKLVIFMRRP